jgi:hypothetical protein
MENNLQIIEDCMKNEFISVNAYYMHRGNNKHNSIGQKALEFAETIKCFQCLDTKQAWYYRDKSMANDGKGEYYIMSCQICPREPLRDKWIEDSHSCDLYSVTGIKLFNKDNHSGADRFKEIERYILTLYPELNLEPSSYKKSEKNTISVKKDTYNLKLEIGNVISKCKDLFKTYCGDLLSLSNLLSSIELNISSCDNSNNHEQIFCEEIDKNNFIYIKIVNNSITKKKSILGLFEFNKYKLDIDISINILKPDNESAYNECKQIVNKLAENNIHDVIKLYLDIENIKDK